MGPRRKGNGDPISLFLSEEARGPGQSLLREPLTAPSCPASLQGSFFRQPSTPASGRRALPSPGAALAPSSSRGERGCPALSASPLPRAHGARGPCATLGHHCRWRSGAGGAGGRGSSPVLCPGPVTAPRPPALTRREGTPAPCPLGPLLGRGPACGSSFLPHLVPTLPPMSSWPRRGGGSGSGPARGALWPRPAPCPLPASCLASWSHAGAWALGTPAHCRPGGSPAVLTKPEEPSAPRAWVCSGFNK